MSIFTLARRMGTSVQVIDATYGHLARATRTTMTVSCSDAYDNGNGCRAARLASSSRSSASSAARPSREMCRAASSVIAQRLWLTTSTLCPSGSRTNAP
jgi:hypothetical protein